MENIEIILVKYILGFGLQSFVLVLGVYTFNKQKIILKEYFIAAILVAIISFVMKFLPIIVGVQTIMNMIFMYLVCVTYLKMHPYRTIRSTALCVVLILLSEMAVTAVIVMTLGQDQFQVIISDSLQRNYIGAVANIAFAVIIMSFYFGLNRKGDYHRSISEQDS